MMIENLTVETQNFIHLLQSPVVVKCLVRNSSSYVHMLSHYLALKEYQSSSTSVLSALLLSISMASITCLPFMIVI